MTRVVSHPVTRRSMIAGSAFLIAFPSLAGRVSQTDPPAPIRSLIARAAGKIDAVTSLWPGAPDAVFLLLLIGPDHEYLFFHKGAPEGFEPLEGDPITGSRVFRRDRVFDPGLLATFPAVEGIPTIVIGYPEATEQPDPADWILTLLHEHFHQRQNSAPDYYPRTNALDLAGDDTTGMWMLTYPFPFDQAGGPFARASHALQAALAGGEAETHAFLAARAALRESVTEPDWRYLAFQVWQEGVARHAEIELGMRSGEADLVRSARAKREKILADLADPDLAERQRVAFYSYGAAEAMLLDRLAPRWRHGYFEGPLSLDPHFEALAT